MCTFENWKKEINNIFKIFSLADYENKLMEAKYHEEKLKLQQKHDADVQKVGVYSSLSF